MSEYYLSPAEREVIKQEIFSALHCALPGTVLSFDAEKQTAEIRPAVRMGSLLFPVLADVPVFMEVPVEVSPGADCMLVFEVDAMDDLFASGEACEPHSARKHSLSDGFAFVGFKAGGA